MTDVYIVVISTFKDPDESRIYCFRNEEDSFRFAKEELIKAANSLPIDLKEY